MGSILGALTSFVGSCLGTAACSVACSCCKYFYQSTSTRLTYVLILLLSMIVQFVVLIPQMAPYLRRIPRLCIIGDANTSNCENIAGYLAVYKIAFGYTMFCMFMILATLGVRSSSEYRAKFHNGLWLIKLILYGLFLFGAFSTPTTFPFLSWMRVFGLAGSLAFVLVQLVLMVDFAFVITEILLMRKESADDERCCNVWLTLLLTISIAGYAGALTMYGYVLVKAPCPLHIFLVIFNIIINIVVTVLTFLPVVRENVPSSGLLQPSVVTCYTAYLILSATIWSNPNQKCQIEGVGESERSILDVVLPIVLFIFSVSYSIVSSTSKSISTVLVAGDQDERTKLSEVTRDEEDQDDESNQVQYTYSFLHFLLMTGCLFVTMTLTNWLEASSDLKHFERNKTSMWIKIVSSWGCSLIYIWSCFAPLLFPDRLFN